MRTRLYATAIAIALPVAILGSLELVVRLATGYFDGLGDSALLTLGAYATVGAAATRQHSLQAGPGSVSAR